MAFIFLPNKVLCPTLKHISEVSLGTAPSNNSLIFLSSLRELVLLVSLFVFLLTYFSLFPVTWHTEAGTKYTVALTALLSSGKVRTGCPGPGWIGTAVFYFHFRSSELLSNSQITPIILFSSSL